MSNHLEDLVEPYALDDVVKSMKSYYSKYRSIPDIEILQERHGYLETVETKGDSQYYLDNLQEDFVKTRLEYLSVILNDKLKSGDSSKRVLTGFQKELSKLNRFTGQARDLNLMDFEAAETRYEKTREKAALMGGVPGIPTGIDFIDAGYTSGLSGGDLIIVLGWTGRGKSLLTTLICCNAYANYKKPMIVSLEMSPEKIQDRAFTILGSGLFKNSDLALGAVDEDDLRSFAGKFKDGREFIAIGNESDVEVTPNFVQSKIDEHKPDIVVIDYAQLTSDNADSNDMTARMRNMSKEYKRLAMANDIPVILISSATPDSTSAVNSPPIIEQVAWSKQLAYDADLAFAVHKGDKEPENEYDVIEVVCRKNRNGSLFAGFIKWNLNSGEWEILYNIDGGL